MKMLTAEQIASFQYTWAIQERIPLEGYTKRVEDNIFSNELHPETRKEYKRGKGHELSGKQAHMKALHSSSALVVNVFDYWRRQNRIEDIAKCCGAKGTITGMEFEKTHPIKGLERTPPHLDVTFTGSIPLAIESKFTETYHRKTRRKDADTHLDEYLKHDEIWNDLPQLKALAESIVQQSVSRTGFEYLDVPQLIKHILGLNSSYQGRFSLLYLWYKINSKEAEQHEQNLAKFSASIDDGISFQRMTYQALFNEIIKHSLDTDSAYLEYLKRRYFSVSQ